MTRAPLTNLASLANLAFLAALACAVSLTVTASAREYQQVFPAADEDTRIGPAGRLPGVTLDSGGNGAGRVFGVSQAPADTFYYGGTVWDAADGRWEAAAPLGAGWVNRNMWTWNSGGYASAPHSGLNMDGWRGVDVSADDADRFHVQSSAEIGACIIAGQKCLFCGLTSAEAADQCYLDVNGTGYGNGWNQSVSTPAYTFDSGDQVTLSYTSRYESEGSYDFTYVILQVWDTANTVWLGLDTLVTYNGAGSATESLDLDALMAALTPPAEFRIAFNFASDGGYSDADGLNPTTCGAFAVDTYSLDDNGTVYTEDFESVPVGGLPAGWEKLSMGYGDFAAVRHLDQLAVPLSEDPCLALAPGLCEITDSVLVFNDPLSPGYPHPMGQDNIAVSSVIDLSSHPGRGGRIFTFERFGKLYLWDLVFYYWQVRYRPGCAAGGWSNWLTDNYVYYSPEGTSCAPVSFDVSYLIPSSAEEVEVALGVWNNCNEWWNWGGYCTDVCNVTPYFDNVTFGVYGTDAAPYLAVREMDYWQDQFAEDGTLNFAGTADSRIANYLSNLDPQIFGDTLVCRSTGNNAELYFVFRMAAVGPYQPLTHGFFSSWFPGVADGGWVEVRMDTAEVTNASATRTLPSSGYWMCAFHESDPVALANGLPEGTEILPNNLFVPGTRVEYFLKSKYSGSGDYFLTPDTTGRRCEEFEVLPMVRGNMMEGVYWPCLIVADHFGGRGYAGERNADRIARHLTASGIEFDIYNKLGPTANLKNGIGRGNVNPGQVGQPGDDQYCCPPGATAAQMEAYDYCILNAGNVYGYSVCQPDAALFTTWLSEGDFFDPRFLWLSGDLIARELNRRTPWGPTFLNDALCATYVSPSYWTASGDGAYCLPVNGIPGARVAHGALGSFTVRTNNCPRRQYGLNVLGVSGSAVCGWEESGGEACGARAEAEFHAGYGGSVEIAAVSNLTDIPCGLKHRTFLEGYDFCLMRSDDSEGPPDCGPDDVLGAWLDSVLAWGGCGREGWCRPSGLVALCPDPATSAVEWRGLACDGAKVIFCPGCPREGMGECNSSSLHLQAYDQFGLPCSGVEVCAEVESADTSVYVCSPAVGVIDSNSEVELEFRAGLRHSSPAGCCSVRVTLTSTWGILLYDSTVAVLSPDYNGDSLVDREDSLVFASDYGTSACRSDFDCDGIVGAQDWSVFAGHYGHGCPSAVIGVEEKPGVSAPPVTTLEQNFPNPFNPVTGIRLSVREAGRVVLRVHDIAGRPVRSLVDEWKDPGVHLVGWDGRDDQGRLVASGVYFYSLVTADGRVTRKMVLVR